MGNKKRMHSYAKAGGLMGYTKGGSVLDEKCIMYPPVFEPRCSDLEVIALTTYY